MDRMLFLSMSGADQVALAQAANNHNLANATTTGFRADLSVFQSLPVYGPTYDSRVYATNDDAGMDLHPGSIVNTGRDLDVAVQGDGYIAVQAPDGSEAYTRRGDLRIDAQGLITTGSGEPVLGNGGPIAVPPYERLNIGKDGTVSIQPLGQAANALATVDRIKLVLPAPASLEKRADGLIALKGGGTADADAAVQIAGGALETSNVNMVESMVRMIELARLFELNVKMMQTAEETDQTTTQLLSLS